MVRGPDWSWNDQDGGPGNEGTVLNVNLSTALALWARVKWASGDENNYRIGAGGKYDLCQVKNKGKPKLSIDSACDHGRETPKFLIVAWHCSYCVS